jgi:hypothetical protein
VGLGGHQVLAAEILGGRQVGIRIDGETLSFFDPPRGSCCGCGPTR